MGWIETRIFELEKRLEYWIRQIQDLIPQLRAAAQTARNAFGQYTIPSSGGGGNPLYCVLSSGLAASGVPGAGSPTTLSSQTLYKISSGGFVSTTSSADVYNGMPNAISSGTTVIVLVNDDGTYSVIAVAC